MKFVTTLGGFLGAEEERKQLMEAEVQGRERMEASMKANVPGVFYDALEARGLEVVYCKDNVEAATGDKSDARGMSAGAHKTLYYAEHGLDGPVAREEALHMLDSMSGGLTRSAEWKKQVHAAIGEGIELGDMYMKDAPRYHGILEARQMLNQAQTWIGKFYSIAYGNEAVVSSVNFVELGKHSPKVYPEILPDMMHVQKMLTDIPTLYYIGKNATPTGEPAIDKALDALQRSVKHAEGFLKPGEQLLETRIGYNDLKEGLDKMTPAARDSLLARFDSIVPPDLKAEVHEKALEKMRNTLGSVVGTYQSFVENDVPAMTGQPPVKLTEVYYQTVDARAASNDNVVGNDKGAAPNARSPHTLTDFDGGPATPMLALSVKK